MPHTTEGVVYTSAVKIQQDFITEMILMFGDFGTRPAGLELDPDAVLKRQFCYFSLEYDAQKRILAGYIAVTRGG